jgi:hypothetical protein
MNIKKTISFILVVLMLSGCISQFIPQTSEDKEILVVEGLITDQPGQSLIKLSKSKPLGGPTSARDLSGCKVYVADDLGSQFTFTETAAGTYTPSSGFNGTVGRLYTLHISLSAAPGGTSYESLPMKMVPVPPIDSVYYEHKTISEDKELGITAEGCEVYLDTYDARNLCKYYRWEYAETWEFMLPYTVPNAKCWVSSNSDKINVKSCANLQENRIKRYPLNFVSNTSDRLRLKYSILVNQYSLSEDEYQYWDKLQSLTQQVGGLYDIIPSSIPSNVYCLNDPAEKVLGYFSVSANSSKRIFIKDNFYGIMTPYSNSVCIADTIWGNKEIQSLGTFVWVIVDHPLPPPSYRVTTRTKGCYDCTVRGTNVPPSFWTTDK